MNILKCASVASLVASLSLGMAGSALAEEGFNGVYRYEPELGDPGNATVSSNCAVDGCVAHIVGERGYVQGDATLQGGQWTLRVMNPHGDICNDNTFPADQVYTWDAVTLSGTLVSNYGPACDGMPGVVTTGFILTKVG